MASGKIKKCSVKLHRLSYTGVAPHVKQEQVLDTRVQRCFVQLERYNEPQLRRIAVAAAAAEAAASRSTRSTRSALNVSNGNVGGISGVLGVNIVNGVGGIGGGVVGGSGGALRLRRCCIRLVRMRMNVDRGNIAAPIPCRDNEMTDSVAADIESDL